MVHIAKIFYLSLYKNARINFGHSHALGVQRLEYA